MLQSILYGNFKAHGGHGARAVDAFVNLPHHRWRGVVGIFVQLHIIPHEGYLVFQRNAFLSRGHKVAAQHVDEQIRSICQIGILADLGHKRAEHVGNIVRRQAVAHDAHAQMRHHLALLLEAGFRTPPPPKEGKKKDQRNNGHREQPHDNGETLLRGFLLIVGNEKTLAEIGGVALVTLFHFYHAAHHLPVAHRVSITVGKAVKAVGIFPKAMIGIMLGEAAIVERDVARRTKLDGFICRFDGGRFKHGGVFCHLQIFVKAFHVKADTGVDKSHFLQPSQSAVGISARLGKTIFSQAYLRKI